MIEKQGKFQLDDIRIDTYLFYNWPHNHGGHPKTVTEQQLRQAVADNPNMLREDLPRFEVKS